MNIKIIYEDKNIIVCHKPAGIAVQTDKLSQKDVVSEIKNYLKSPYLGIIHRLDQPVEGVLLFAKTKQAAAELTRQISNNTMKKTYRAVICGQPTKKEETLVDYLKKDGRTNTSFTTTKQDKEGKYAELSYKVIEEKEKLSLIEIQLKTGRHHQIRVQMSNAGYPLLGDLKYGTEETVALSKEMSISTVALCAYSLEFIHPGSKKKVCYSCTPQLPVFERGFLHEGKDL